AEQQSAVHALRLQQRVEAFGHRIAPLVVGVAPGMPAGSGEGADAATRRWRAALWAARHQSVSRDQAGVPGRSGAAVATVPVAPTVTVVPTVAVVAAVS